MIKLYGPKMSRASRCIVALEECGLKYELHEISLDKDEHKKSDYLKLNPNGTVPTLVDGDNVLWESMAINLYLAEKYGKDLMPTRVEERGQVYKWSVWAIATLEPPLVTVFLNRVRLPEAERSAAAADAAVEKAGELLKILNHELEGKNFLVGERFTIGDLNVGHCVAWGNMLGIDMSAVPNVQAWMAKVTARPGVQKVLS